MATPYSVPIEAFFRRVEADKGFFQYFNLSDEEALALATERATGYMHEALARIMMDAMPTVDFTDVDDEAKVFNFDLVPKEVYLIASLMYEAHLSRDVAKIKLMNVNYTSKDLRVFDPSNARSTFMEMYEFVCNQNISLLDSYRDSDRMSGAFNTINFAENDIDAEV